MKWFYRQCCENIEQVEGYEDWKKNNFKGYALHHRLETHDKWGNKREDEVPRYVLEQLGLYYHRPAKELIFLTNSEHTKVHCTFAGGHRAKKQAKTITEKQRLYGSYKKGCKLKTSSKNMISNSLQIYFETNEGKEQRKLHGEIMSKKKWYNNGTISLMAESCPEGFIAGRIMKNMKRYKRG